MNNEPELENAVKAMRGLAKSATCASKAWGKLAGIRPIPHLNFYHRCRLRVCRWFGLLTDWIWEIKDKKGR